MELVELVRAPERSYAQRMEALSRANAVRSFRKGLKKRLKGYEEEPQALLVDPPAELATMKVADLMLAVPKYGRVKVNKILMRCRISPSKTVGGLTERQRRELAVYLPRLR